MVFKAPGMGLNTQHLVLCALDKWWVAGSVKWGSVHKLERQKIQVHRISS